MQGVPWESVDERTLKISKYSQKLWLEFLLKHDVVVCVFMYVCCWLANDDCLWYGRAPVLVALALIELGMKYEDAVELIRQWVTHRVLLLLLLLSYVCSNKCWRRLKFTHSVCMPFPTNRQLSWQLAVWHSSCFVRRINKVTLCWAWLVLGWVNVFGQVYHLGGICWCERLADGWGTTATTRVPMLRIGERPREWTRG